MGNELLFFWADAAPEKKDAPPEVTCGGGGGCSYIGTSWFVPGDEGHVFRLTSYGSYAGRHGAGQERDLVNFGRIQGMEAQMACMDFRKLEGLGIRNLRSVFGRGARGETLARGCHMGPTLERIWEAGVRIIVDLRTADHNDKLARRCAEVGLAYHHAPVDAKTVAPEALSTALPVLFRILDGDGFYLSCQQGLHRTDIALALYYFFHDDGVIPEMVGHRAKGFLRCDDIMRRINAMRSLFPEVDDYSFVERRKRFLEFNREFTQSPPAVRSGGNGAPMR